jgi:hypothetical protein
MKSSFIKKILTASLVVVFLSLSACGGVSIENIEESIKTKLEKRYEDEGIEGFTVLSIDLTETSENNYSGLVNTDQQGQQIQYDIAVVVDGENIEWDITNKVIK